MATQTERTAEEVFNDHLEQSKHGSVEVDMERNYAKDVALLTGRGLYRGHEGLRYLAQLLREELPNATFDYTTTLVAGEMAFLEWTAEAEGAYVDDGADSFLIREGQIIAQTIHYTLKQDKESIW